MRLGVLALLLSALLGLAACGGGDGEDQAAGDGCKVQPADGGGDVPSFDPLDPKLEHRVEVQTNKGEFTITLDAARFPCTGASFVHLVQDAFYDGTIIHRIVPGFIVQGGDPTGSGTGGPGYTTVEPTTNVRYPKGAVAMAKTIQEPIGTAGSQFFVVTGENTSLPSEYALLGEVTDGLDVVLAIDKLGNLATEKPTQRVVVERMRLVT